MFELFYWIGITLLILSLFHRIDIANFQSMGNIFGNKTILVMIIVLSAEQTISIHQRTDRMNSELGIWPGHALRL